MSLEEKSADAAAAAAAAENEEGDGEGSSAIAAGIRRDVKPWLNLVDDLSNLTRDAEISVPQVRFVCVCVLCGTGGFVLIYSNVFCCCLCSFAHVVPTVTGDRIRTSNHDTFSAREPVCV